MSTNMELWIEALRSGNYQQITGSLCASIEEDNDTTLGYCCLGVAEVLREGEEHPDGGLPEPELADWLGVSLNKDELDNDEEWDPKVDIPSNVNVGELMECLGVTDFNENHASLYSECKRGRGVAASSMNDDYMLSFTQIANLIEKFGIKEIA